MRRHATVPVLAALVLGACSEQGLPTSTAGAGAGGSDPTSSSTTVAQGTGASTATSGGGVTAGVGGSGSPTTGAGGDGGADATTGTGDPGTGGSTGGAGGEGGAGGAAVESCDAYPSTLTIPDVASEAAAELESLAPGAALDWSDAHGTLSLVTDLGVTLDCAGHGDDVWDAAWAVLEAHPALFQLDRTEWNDAGPFPCSAATGTSVVNTSRASLAGVDVRTDVLAIVVRRDGDAVELHAVSGFYLPVLSSDAIDECPAVAGAELEAAARAVEYDYATFSFCSPTGSGTYAPQPDDTFTLGESWWEWREEAGLVVASERRAATLVIDPSNVTDDLVASDANCPDATGEERVFGFSLILDPVTGKIVDVRPGIGCIVC